MHFAIILLMCGNFGLFEAFRENSTFSSVEFSKLQKKKKNKLNFKKCYSNKAPSSSKTPISGGIIVLLAILLPKKSVHGKTKKKKDPCVIVKSIHTTHKIWKLVGVWRHVRRRGFVWPNETKSVHARVIIRVRDARENRHNAYVQTF